MKGTATSDGHICYLLGSNNLNKTLMTLPAGNYYLFDAVLVRNYHGNRSYILPGQVTLTEDTKIIGITAERVKNGVTYDEIKTPKLAPLPVIVEPDLSYSQNAVGKLLSVRNNNHFENSLQIDGVKSGKIYYSLVGDKDPFETINEKSEVEVDDFSLWCNDCYDEGVIDLGIGAFATGENAKATNRAAFASGRDTHAYGSYSTAIGRQTKAGHNAFATGRETEATGDGSFSGGKKSKAKGAYSFAHGETSAATGIGSYAQGYSAGAAGAYSHAQNFNTQALGDYSTAEGEETRASGKGSHSQGLQTSAASDYQHAEGKFNISDKLGKYVHIIGNGTSSKRSNAHTLDWDGNAEYAGDVKANACGGKNPISLIDVNARKLEKSAFTFDAETCTLTLTL